MLVRRKGGGPDAESPCLKNGYIFLFLAKDVVISLAVDILIFGEPCSSWDTPSGISVSEEVLNKVGGEVEERIK